MYGIRKFFAAVLSVAGILGATAADNLTVETPAALFPLPGADTQLVLAEKMPSPDGEVKYVVRDYTGKETGASTARRQAGKITLDLKLGAGYHELFFPEYNQSVGLAVHPDAPAGSDGYWCMDSGLTWSPAKPSTIPNPGTKFVIYRIRGRHVLVNNVCTPETRTRDLLEIWVSDDNLQSWSKKLPLARLHKENPDTWQGFWDGGDALPQVAYPHGFADDKEEKLYLALDSVRKFFFLKVPYSDLL